MSNLKNHVNKLFMNVFSLLMRWNFLNFQKGFANKPDLLYTVLT